jgi:hypothetical protein
MLYNDDFILSLPDDSNAALAAVIGRLLASGDQGPQAILEARDLVVAISYRHGLDTASEAFRTSPDANVIRQALNQIYHRAIDSLQTEASLDKQQHFAALLGHGFYYEFSEADTKRVQDLVNELRGLITESTRFEPDHRTRILDKLEMLQREIHRRISNLDRIYGLIGDAGVMLGKFGNDARPFVDRIREIVEIAWRSQANAEQLPASARPALLTTEHETPPHE